MGATAGDWNEVRRWRKVKRATLIALRQSVSAEERAARALPITRTLEPIVANAAPRLIGFY
ncbi:MAG TPA: hypothetical protein VHS58_04970 [Acetobacteraceae bacterium]|nr:hypothetical protein [Acetobacteraceae bacterium]